MPRATPTRTGTPSSRYISGCNTSLCQQGNRVNDQWKAPYISLVPIMHHTVRKWWLLQSNGALIQLSERSTTLSPVYRVLYKLLLEMSLLEPSLCVLVCSFSSITRALDKEHDHYSTFQPALLIMSTKSRISVQCGCTQLIAGNGEWSQLGKDELCIPSC